MLEWTVTSPQMVTVASYWESISNKTETIYRTILDNASCLKWMIKYNEENEKSCMWLKNQAEETAWNEYMSMLM